MQNHLNEWKLNRLNLLYKDTVQNMRNPINLDEMILCTEQAIWSGQGI